MNIIVRLYKLMVATVCGQVCPHNSHTWKGQVCHCKRTWLHFGPHKGNSILMTTEWNNYNLTKEPRK